MPQFIKSHTRDSAIREFIQETVNQFLTSLEKAVKAAQVRVTPEMERIGVKILFLKETFPDLFNQNSAYSQLFKDFSQKTDIYDQIVDLLSRFYAAYMEATEVEQKKRIQMIHYIIPEYNSADDEEDS